MKCKGCGAPCGHHSYCVECYKDWKDKICKKERVRNKMKRLAAGK